MKKGLFILALAAVGAVSQAVTFTYWDFNTNPSDGLTSTGTLVPNFANGAASIALTGGTTSTFAAGFQNPIADNSVAAGAGANNSGWNTTTYPAASANNGTAGIQAVTPTTGYYNISVTWDQRHSNTASKWVRFDYSNDGGINWILGSAGAGSVFSAATGDVFNADRSVDLSGDPLANNNPNLRFRIVSIFAPGGGSYVASTTGSTYGTTGTWRFDSVRVAGTVVPEPASMIALGVGVVTILARRRKRA